MKKAAAMRTLVLASAMLAAGCATNQRCAPECVAPPCTSFERLACFDFRPNAPGGPNSLEDFRKFVQPGDLVVVYMEFQRAIVRRQWIFTVLPVGHALVVLDPHSPRGLLETRFMGAQMIGPEELLQYSHCQVYRLRDRSLLDMNRLHEFAAYSCEHIKDYDPWSWIGWNGEMSPDDLSEISPTYSCSNFLAAAYYYSGVSLSVGRLTNKVVTPLSVAASIACPNRFSTGNPQLEMPPQIKQ
jgi:hypothetical protein